MNSTLKPKKTNNENPNLLIAFASGFIGQYLEAFVNFHFIGAKVMQQAGITYPKFHKSPIKYYTTCTRGVTGFQTSVLFTATLETQVDNLHKKFEPYFQIRKELISGAIGIFGGFLISTPVEHTILTLQKEKLSPFAAFRSLILNHGWGRPWVGAIPTMGREFIYWGGLSATGNNDSLSNPLDGNHTQYIKKIIAGMIASAFSEPLDVTARVMQDSLKPKKLISTMVTIKNEKGIKFFFRGYKNRTASVIGSYFFIPLLTDGTKKILTGLHENSTFGGPKN